MITTLILAAALTAQGEYSASFVSCYDGDTCTFNVHLGMDVVLVDQHVRFCDVNTPEIRPLATREAATKARDALVGWLKEAKKVVLRVPQKKNCNVAAGDTGCDKRGKYGRWLVYVLADTINLNQRLVTEGFAESYLECE